MQLCYDRNEWQIITKENTWLLNVDQVVVRDLVSLDFAEGSREYKQYFIR